MSQCNSDNYCIANIALTGNDRIEFQSGDVVGWYTTPDARYGMMTIRTDGYVVYFRLSYTLAPPTSANISENSIGDRFQPLIQFVIGMYIYDIHYIHTLAIAYCTAIHITLSVSSNFG